MSHQVARSRFYRTFGLVGLICALGAEQGPCLVIGSNTTPGGTSTQAPAERRFTINDPVFADEGTLPEQEDAVVDENTEEPTEELEEPTEDLQEEPEEEEEPATPALRTLEGEVTLRTQEDINKLADVVKINGNLRIGIGFPPDLKPLRNLREVTGYVSINPVGGDPVTGDLNFGDDPGAVPPRKFGALGMYDLSWDYPAYGLKSLNGLAGATIGRLNLYSSTMTAPLPAGTTVKSLYMRGHSSGSLNECHVRAIGSGLGLTHDAAAVTQGDVVPEIQNGAYAYADVKPCAP